MEGAFFVGRTELLTWVNATLEVNLTKVEQCANGAVYCQIADACKPGSVALRKVNWMAKSDHEYIPNYKVLQQSFERLGIEKHIEVDKLIRAKYQDNLEFLQWMKCLWDRENVAGARDYDPQQGREGKPVPPWARASTAGTASSTGAPRPGEKENFRPSTAETGKRTVAPGARPAAAAAAASGPARTRAPAAPAASGGYRGAAAPEAEDRPASAAAARRASQEERRVNEDLQNQLAQNRDELEDLRCAMEQVEKERDYYFRQLRDVEIMCQTLQSNMPADLSAGTVVNDVMGILYADADDEDQQDRAP